MKVVGAIEKLTGEVIKLKDFIGVSSKQNEDINIIATSGVSVEAQKKQDGKFGSYNRVEIDQI